MDADSAKNLIQKTFQSSFDEDQYKHFVKELLNHIEETPSTVYRGNYIPDAFKSYVSKLKRIGKYQDKENKRIDVLTVKLQKRTSLERARSMQRNFISWYLKSRDSKDAALVAYVSPNGKDWRFSFVKMDYKFEEKDDGRLKAKEEFTSARRYSFLVGENENSHTAQSRFIPLLIDDKNDPTLDQLEEAFSIEKVTKEFFEKYRELYLSLKEALDEIVKRDSKIKEDFKNKNIDTVDFSKKLLGQIIFLYFLQKKGWFGVVRDKDWGTGPKNFLRQLFEKKHGNYENFFNDILEPLFYEALRIGEERKHDDYYYSRFKCKIPFLNGGLFDPINNYDWFRTDIVFPDELFSNNKKTKEGDNGTGILDVFDRYNFTVKEDEPLEKEVAIDPEMLGKVFENLLEVKDRKSKGTYYTPREIVHCMCQESLINYLDSSLNIQSQIITEKEPVKPKLIGKTDSEQLNLNKKNQNSPIRKEDFEEFIKKGELIIEHDTRVMNEGRETERYPFLMPESIRTNAELIDEMLSNIRVCDPAVGSGAFLVGMMNEIVKARHVLSTYLENKKIKNNYEFKNQAIQNCLYGVDIDHGAVEIAKLRLWLSLVVEEENIKNIRPLPNLDYKIVKGNSLIGLNYESSGLKEIENRKKKLFYETSPSKKNELRKEIDFKINERLSNSEKTVGYKVDFDFNLFFSEVFQDKDGFDIVIANPPYLKERDNKKIFEEVRKSDWGRKNYQGKMDYWYFFLHKAIDITRIFGVISFITSRYWLNSTGAKKLIIRIQDELSFVVIVDIGKLKIFDEVAGRHMVAIYSKDKTQKSFISKQLEKDLSEICQNKDTENLTISVLKNSEVFTKTNQIELDIDKLTYINIIPLGNIFDVSQGVVQNPDKVSRKAANKYKLPVGEGVFVLNEDEFKKLGLAEHEKIFVKPFFDEHDISKYHVRSRSNKYLLYITKDNCNDISKYPNIKSHLEKYKNIMSDRRETKKGSNKWFHLHWPRESRYFENPKVILPTMFDTSLAGYQENSSYFGISTNVIVQKSDEFKLKYLLAILNSDLAQYWFRKHGKKRGIGVDIGVTKLREFPIRKASISQQNDIISLIDKIIVLTKNKNYLQKGDIQSKVCEYENEINYLVFKVYNFTKEEMNIIEESVKS